MIFKFQRHNHATENPQNGNREHKEMRKEDPEISRAEVEDLVCLPSSIKEMLVTDP